MNLINRKLKEIIKEELKRKNNEDKIRKIIREELLREEKRINEGFKETVAALALSAMSMFGGINQVYGEPLTQIKKVEINDAERELEQDRARLSIANTELNDILLDMHGMINSKKGNDTYIKSQLLGLISKKPVMIKILALYFSDITTDFKDIIKEELISFYNDLDIVDLKREQIVDRFEKLNQTLFKRVQKKMEEMKKMENGEGDFEAASEPGEKVVRHGMIWTRRNGKLSRRR